METKNSVVKPSTPVQPKTETPVRIITIAGMFRKLGNGDFKTRNQMAIEIVAELKKNGVTVTKKNNLLTEKLVMRQIRNMVREINLKGEKKVAWTKKAKFVENDKFVKLELKL